MEELGRLTTALAIGLLVGAERGWSKKELPEGRRAAGLRTFGVIGLFGGLASLLSGPSPWVLAAAFLALGALVVSGYVASSERNHDVGLTTEAASLAVFALGAASQRGFLLESAVCAVLLTSLLSLKATLHSRLAAVGEQELRATLKLLLLVIVLLPVLPDKAMGPWGAWNPFELGWMAVLIAGISYVGYFAMKAAGPGYGTGLTSLLGGLVSSTAVTLDLARRDAADPVLHRLHAAGIVLASATLFPRVVLEASAVHPALGRELALPLGLMAAAGFAVGAMLWRHARSAGRATAQELGNPLSLRSAAKFVLVLAGVFLVAAALRDRFGHSGLLLSAAVAGIADVDAITLALARMAREGLDLEIAAGGVYAAVAVNTLVKAGMAVAIGTSAMSRLAGGALLSVLLVGAAALSFL